MFKMLKGIAIAGALAATIGSAVTAADPIPLDAFTTLPFIQTAGVSPDGKKMALARALGKDGGYIVEIFDTDDLGKKPVRLGADKMELRSFTWLNNKRLIVSFRQLKDTDQGGGSHWVSTSAIVNANGKGKWMYLPRPTRGPTFVVDMLPHKPDEILVAYESDDILSGWYPDYFLLNVNTGRTNLVIKGNSKRGSYINDYDGEIRGAQGFDESSGTLEYYAREKGSDNWKLIKAIKPDSETREDFDIFGFSKENPNELFVRANQGQDKSGIYALNVQTGEMSERLFGLKSVDAGGIVRSRKADDYGRLLGFSYTTGSYKRYYTDEAEGALWKAIQDLFPGKSVYYIDRSEDDNAIILYTTSDRDPGSYYLLRNKSDLKFIGSEFPLLKEEELAEQKYVRYQARDGRSIPAYVTIPHGKAPFPAIVLPHGGPWVRDTGGYDEWAQLLASRGYIVIQPNYRGSTGYGLDHWKAGDGKWGLEMQDDLDDAALYLVEQGLATKDKLAMFGWSYGGFAAFAASVREPQVYQCSIPGAGVSDLDRINAGIYGNEFLRRWQRPTIDGMNPYDNAEKVNIPVFVVHGDYDQRVPVEQSRIFVDKLKGYNKDHKYLEIEELDHFYSTFKHEHKVQFFNALLDYLASDKCFGK